MISEFEKEKVFWTRKMNLKLVKFVQSKPQIWNPKHPMYTSSKARDLAYAEFANKYGNDFTGQAVKDRWTNIRSTFGNYLRKSIASRMKPNNEEYKINWHLWEPCQFLLKVSKRGKLDTTGGSNDEDYEEKAKFSSDEDLSNSIRNNLNPNCKDIVNGLVNVFSQVQNDAFGLNNTTHGQIGQAVARKLSQMHSYEAAKVSQKIMDILLFYDEHNPNNPNNKI